MEVKNKLLKRLYSKKINDSNRRRIEFSISLELFISLSQLPCDYCGAVPSNTITDKKSGVSVSYSGLDRVNSKLGYLVTNVVPCCRFCNSLKGSMPAATWLSFLDGVVKHHKAAKWPLLETNGDQGRPKKSYFNR